MQSPIAYCMKGKRRYLGDSRGIFSFLMSSCCIPKACAVCLPKCHVFTDEELKDDEFVCWRRPWRSWWLVLQVLQLKGKGNQQGTATCGVMLCWVSPFRTGESSHLARSDEVCRSSNHFLPEARDHDQHSRSG